VTMRSRSRKYACSAISGRSSMAITAVIYQRA
jgi:hypothetical protein